MTLNKTRGETDAGPATSTPSAAEAKRLAARRRFLKLGGVTGPAFVILTVYHRRSWGGSLDFRLTPNRAGQTLWVSSATTCMSLGGRVTTSAKEVTDSLTGKQVTRVGCDRG